MTTLMMMMMIRDEAMSPCHVSPERPWPVARSHHCHHYHHDHHDHHYPLVVGTSGRGRFR